MKDKYLRIQVQNTFNEVERMKKSGMILVSKNEFECMLESVGLHLDLNQLTTKYYNTLNENHWFECSTYAFDCKNISFANTDGFFYQNHVLKKTEIYERFKEIRNTYFCLIENKYILSI